MSPISFDSQSLRQIIDPPFDPSSEYEAVFPLAWYTAFLETLLARRVQIITYRDLFAHSDDWDFQSCYRREFENWHRHIRDPERIYLLIQHDVDLVPSFTRRIVALEATYGIRSNIFIFNEPIDDLLADPSWYDVDHPFFQQAERNGFVIGYHQNALVLSKSDMDSAVEQFRRDVEELSRSYRIEFFCPHGGRGHEINGRLYHNYDVPLPPEYQRRVRWIYNRYSVRFHGRWSDGGLRRVTDAERLTDLDLVERFVNSMQPGKRYFALIHPQLWGYNINMDYNPALRDQHWYQHVCRQYSPSSARQRQAKARQRRAKARLDRERNA